MQQFLIEVPHAPEHVACARVVKIFLTTGSHFLTHADWGCMDRHYGAWMVVETENKEVARLSLPPQLRAQASIVGLNKFSIEQIESILGQHPDEADKK